MAFGYERIVPEGSNHQEMNSSVRCERQRTKSAEPRARTAHPLPLHTQSRKAANDPRDRQLSFEPSNGHAGAGVAARGECQMLIRNASNFEPVRLREHVRIPVGCADA